MSSAINQKQIAALAGVSQTVVSRVLSGRAKEIGIADETVQRVIQIAERFNYRPNIGASIIQGRKTNLLGVIVRSFDDHLIMSLLAELRHLASSSGYSLIVTGFDHGIYNERDIQMLDAYRPDAYFILGTMNFSAWPLYFFNSGKPIINITESAHSNPPQIHTVSVDEAQGAKLMVQHLLNADHSCIGLITDNHPANRQRLQTFRQQLTAQDILVRPEWIFSSDLAAAAAGTDAAGYYCKHASRSAWPTAFCAMDDSIAIGTLRGLLAHGINVPGEISVTGFNDIPAAQFTYPSLTTVAQPIQQMAQVAMSFITESEGKVNKPWPSFVPRLRLRESSSEAKHANTVGTPQSSF